MIKEEWIKFKEYIMENDGAKISDCVDMSNVFSFLPYKFNYMESYIANAEINELLKIINEEMMRVITDTKEYIPLQYIAEYIKSIGYDGFLYGSVVGEGVNLVMFNNVKCSMKNREEKQININNWLK